MSEAGHGSGAEATGAASQLAGLLDREPGEWRRDLDARYGVLDDVLAARRATVVYPAARMGREAAARLRAMGANVVALGDRDMSLHGNVIDGLPVLSPAEIARSHASDVILVASTMFDSAIREDLLQRGCAEVVPVGYLNLRLPRVFRSREYEGAYGAVTDPASRAAIRELYGLLADDQSRRVLTGKVTFYLGLDKRQLEDVRSRDPLYFDPTVYELGSQETVVDGGAFVGDTLESFLHASGGDFSAYHAFEPDEASFGRLAQLASADPSRITVVRAGLGSRRGSARLLGTGKADSRLLSADEPGDEETPVVSLDEYFDGLRLPSLIKMDVEGWEEQALMGAKRVLAEARPKVAVSVYHSPHDLWSIPLQLNRLLPDASLFLRHYTREVDDTVCYAIPEDRQPRRA